jgi:hypothetical protein
VEKVKPFQDAQMIAELHEMVNKLTEENEQLFTQNEELRKHEQDYKDNIVELMHARLKIAELTEQLAAQPVQTASPAATEETTQLQNQLLQITQHAEQLTQEYFNKEVQYQQVLTQLQQLNQDQEIQATLLATALQRGQDADDQRHHAYGVLELKTQELEQLKVDRDALVAHINELASMPAEPVPAYEPDDGPLTNQQVQQIQELAAPSVTPRTDFGPEFPHSPDKGDMFLRTDFKPSRLFKWNEQTWIQVNKNTTDVYAYNEMYVAFLIQKLQDREYEWDDLSATEQQQVTAVTGGPIV